MSCLPCAGLVIITVVAVHWRKNLYLHCSITSRAFRARLPIITCVLKSLCLPWSSFYLQIFGKHSLVVLKFACNHVGLKYFLQLHTVGANAWLSSINHQVFAELKDLADKISAEKLVSPTLIIIGKVVALSPFYSNSFKEASMLVEAKWGNLHSHVQRVLVAQACWL